MIKYFAGYLSGPYTDEDSDEAMIDVAYKLLNEDTRSRPPLDGNPSCRHFLVF